jgi:glutamate-1-semialdehyde 2,1-aminomutase
VSTRDLEEGRQLMEIETHAARGFTFDRSRELNERLHSLVPGGAHTYAKGDDQFPEGLAPILSHGRGCHVWDVDGNEYIEYGMGLRAVTLGHGFPRVVDAVRERIGDGTNFVRPSTLELEAAESFLALIEGADMVKFTKDGSTANTAAVKLARAYTGRELVALCADHPFFSYDDWAMIVTPVKAGIPASVEPLTVTFRYNDLSSVEDLLARYPGRIACFVLEPERAEPPRDGFLHRLVELAHQNGALVVLDENVTGFRWANGGGQAVYGIVPDLSAWGKGIANGFAVAALAGRREVMELGGLRHDGERVFLLSTTHGAEHAGLAAAVATMATYREEPVVATLIEQGERLRSGLQDVIDAHGVGDAFSVFGKASCLYYGTRDAAGEPSQKFRTLFLQETITRGVLAPSLVISYAHTDADLERTIEIVDEALGVYAAALDQGIARFLHGRPVQPVYRARN